MMNLARSDTFINVYIPREDCEDPRRYVSQNSPVFNSESGEVYRFSDMVIKDRPLFMGRKSVSMYEILTKRKRVYRDGSKYSSHSHQTLLEEEHDADPLLRYDENATGYMSPRTVSLNLDSKGGRKPRNQPPRFNEPLNAYITNKKKVQMIHNYELGGSRNDRKVKIPSLQARNVQTYLNSQSPEQFMSSKKQAKSKSAVVFRSEQSLSLPPIQPSFLRSQTAFPPLAAAQINTDGVVRALPVRPSSKPQKIWKQSSDMLANKNGMPISRLMIRSLAFNNSKIAGNRATTSFPVK